VADSLVVWVGLEVGAVLDVVEVLDVVLASHLPAQRGIAHSNILIDIITTC
jgi:hypothetical protein